MANASYHQFCPVAMAAELLCKRWTMLVVRELVVGSMRFNDLRRGLPKMSRTLLAQRLRELETAGIVDRQPVPGSQSVNYTLTPAGRDLFPVVEAFGIWGQKWIKSDPALKNLDASLLMWDMRRFLDLTPLPSGRTVIQFRFRDLPASKRDWWLVVDPTGEADLCLLDPGFEVDLLVTTDLRTMTAVWMGLTTIRAAAGNFEIEGRRNLSSTMQKWLGLSPFAKHRKLAS